MGFIFCIFTRELDAIFSLLAIRHKRALRDTRVCVIKFISIPFVKYILSHRAFFISIESSQYQCFSSWTYWTYRSIAQEWKIKFFPDLIFQLTPVGSTIFKNVVAVDADAGVNGIVEYSIAPGDGTGIGNNDGVGRNRITTADGYGYFSINLPHQGQVTVNRTLDFERTQRYLVTILASVSALFFFFFASNWRAYYYWYIYIYKVLREKDKKKTWAELRKIGNLIKELYNFICDTFYPSFLEYLLLGKIYRGKCQEF